MKEKNRLRACFWNLFSFLVFIYSNHVHQRQFGTGRILAWQYVSSWQGEKRVSFQASCEKSTEPSWKWYKGSLHVVQESVFFGNLLLVPRNKLTRVCSTSRDTVWVLLPLLRTPPGGVTTVSSTRLRSRSGLTLQGLLLTGACYSSHIMGKAAWDDVANLPDLLFL